MDPAGFLDDLENIPDHLQALSQWLWHDDPWVNARGRAQYLLTGMGSSAYAGRTAAGWLRSAGLSVVDEIASLAPGMPGGDDTAAILISATGGSVETLDRRARLHRDTLAVALTNDPASELAAGCDSTVPMKAGAEVGGVACRTYRHTLALLLALGRPIGEIADRCAEAATLSTGLLSDRSWLEEVDDALRDAPATFWIAPANRLGSALQSALMMREGPRRLAVGCETGDWSHVDVYLTATMDYRAVVFTGSPWDEQAADWMRRRRATVVSVGPTALGVTGEVHVSLDAEPLTALLVEPLVAELLAHRWWQRQPPVVAG